MDASGITSTLFNNLNFRGERQKVISSNIANINTPNYKTKELVFENELNNSKNKTSLEMYKTNTKHLSMSNTVSSYPKTNLVEIKGLEEQNDGNNVNLDTQMGEMSKNKMIFDAIQSSIKKDALFFKSVIDSSSKN
jgi:flagellar basal-body rod protein FlgB